MAIGLTPKEEQEYVLKEDQDKDPGDASRSVFRYRTLTGIQRTKLEDTPGYRQADDEYLMRVGTLRRNAVRGGLVGWENYLDGSGEPIPFEVQPGKINVLGEQLTGVPSDKTIDRLTPAHLHELAEAITENQRLTKDEVKNS